MTITELAIKRPTLIVVIFGALIVLGLYSYTQLSYELLPKMNSPFITVTTVYPGASPNEVETSVSKPIEDAISSVDQLKSLRSTSSEGVSFVTAEFDQAVNVDVTLQNTQRKVNEILSSLPEGSETPTVSKFAIDEIPVLRMGITSNMPSREFYQFIKDRIQPRISKVKGVAQISLVGGDEREIKINLDVDKIQTYGLSILQVTNAVKNSNLDFPTGKIKGENEQLIVRVAGKFSSVDELRNLIVARSAQGGEIKLKDVAEVEDGTKEHTNLTRINGTTSVGLLMYKQTDANAVEVSKLVRNEITMMENDYKDANLKFDIAQDGSMFTIDAANAVKFDLGLAVILVAIVMLLFLHSIRNSFIVLLAIPASMISTFIAMYMFGFTLNLMTLLALSLVVGILVDDSIVVLENIYHHMEKGEDKRTASLKGRNEIGFAALAITLVDVVVFLPLALTGGLIGNIIRQFALVVVISTLLSLFVSFTVTPLLASRIGKLGELTNKTIIGKFAIWFENGFRKLTEHYLGLLKWSLNNRWKVLAGTVALFFASLALVPAGFIGSEFIAQSDRGEFAVTIELPSGTTLERTNFVTQKVENIISSLPEVKKVFVNVGASNEGLIGQSTSNSSELNVTLVDKELRDKSTDQVGHLIKKKIMEIPDVTVRVNPIGIFGTANATPIQIIVKGPNREDVQKASLTVMDVLKKIAGTTDVRLSSDDAKPETRVEIDREKLASFGLSIAEVGATLRIALTGDDDSKYRDGDNEYDIRISLDQFDRSKISDLSRLTFMNPRGQLVELQQFANIFETAGPTKLERKDRISSIVVFSQVNGRPSGSIGQDFQAAMIKEKLPKGVELVYDGDLKNQADSFGSLGLAMLAGILFVYMIMVALYDSYVYPFVVLFSIPVAMVGALFALALTMNALSIFTMLGIIMLIGLVAKNAILLVDRTTYNQREGMETNDAILEAGKSRIRPIFMTTLTMVFGMLPIALSSSAGSEWKSGLAWGLVGGLTSSMFLTLVLVPVIFTFMEGLKDKIPGLYRKVFNRKIKIISGLEFQEGN
ncbi:MAG TPA: acriflavin resistance protein [Ignavibacteriales bacterium]|nr:acriflavin resistance protein [Ignavibacteriales bacterium]